jgi:endoglucanase
MNKLYIYLLAGIITTGLIFLSMRNGICSELSSNEQLKQSWKTYKSFFIQDDGRVIDFYGNNITTSEGQSYAMLRALWHNDKEIFDKALNWANNNLKIRGDNLFGWKWGQNNNGEWSIIDKASATDAEEDIALALILASKKWNNDCYKTQARAILKDMWDKEVINIKGKNYLTAGDWAVHDVNVKLNPSYFAPYAYRIFATIDKDHDWNSLVDSSYEVIKEASSFSVFYLPPDWCYINKNTGEITIDKTINKKESDYSYDAIRTHWRIALDYILNKDPRAYDYLKKSTKFFIDYWEINGSLPTSVTVDGVIRKGEESYAIYGAVLPAIAIINPQVAKKIYHQKLAADYIKGFWGNPKDYYGQNLVWFGIALWQNVDSK